MYKMRKMKNAKFTLQTTEVPLLQAAAVYSSACLW